MGGNESVEVTAGIWGFLVLFGLALACWFLFRSMNTHIRRVNFTEREGARRDGSSAGAPEASRDATATASTASGASHASDDDPIGGPRH